MTTDTITTAAYDDLTAQLRGRLVRPDDSPVDGRLVGNGDFTDRLVRIFVGDSKRRRDRTLRHRCHPEPSSAVLRPSAHPSAARDRREPGAAR